MGLADLRKSTLLRINTYTRIHTFPLRLLLPPSMPLRCDYAARRVKVLEAESLQVCQRYAKCILAARFTMNQTGWTSSSGANVSARGERAAGYLCAALASVGQRVCPFLSCFRG